MVDQKARREYAQLVRQFISGRMTNDEYEDRFEAIQCDPKDLVVREVYHQLWFCYDDIRTHKMTDSHRLDAENRRTIARAVLFLQSDSEYQWPEDAMLGNSLMLWLFLVGILSIFLMGLFYYELLLVIVGAVVLGLSLSGYYRVRSIVENRRWKMQGDTEAWPFLHKTDLEEATRHPRLLNGGRTMP